MRELKHIDAVVTSVTRTVTDFVEVEPEQTITQQILALPINSVVLVEKVWVNGGLPVVVVDGLLRTGQTGWLTFRPNDGSGGTVDRGSYQRYMQPHNVTRWVERHLNLMRDSALARISFKVVER